jgi:hypothetical protein
MHFERWKALTPVMNVAKWLSFDEGLAQSRSWDEYEKLFTAANGDDGQMIKAAHRFLKKASTGEVSVLAAMLYAGGFADVADEISRAGLWTRFGRTRGEHAEAVALVITR